MTQDKQDIVFGWATVAVIISVLMWLQSTNKAPQPTVSYMEQYKYIKPYKEQSKTLEKYGELITKNEKRHETH